MIPTLQAPKILIVEDDYLLAEAVCDFVRDSGYSVAGKVGRVDAGVRFVNENAIDGAIVDVNLHGFESFPICDELKTREIPFFFLTGYDSRIHLPARFSDAQMLPKPIDESLTRAALARIAKAPAKHATSEARDNRILDGLSTEEWAFLAPLLERVEMKPRQVLESPGTPTEFVYFPVSGLISIVTPAGQGRMLEVGQIGRDGMTGLGVVLGSARATAGQAVVQIAGVAWRCRTRDLLARLQKSPQLHARALNAVYAFISQMADSAVWIGNATIEQRLARWILSAARHAGDQPLRFSHQQLASILAVRRAGVTTALHMLEGKGYIRATRNMLRIRNLAALTNEHGSATYPVD